MAVELLLLIILLMEAKVVRLPITTMIMLIISKTIVRLLATTTQMTKTATIIQLEKAGADQETADVAGVLAM